MGMLPKEEVELKEGKMFVAVNLSPHNKANTLGQPKAPLVPCSAFGYR
jgi:hypothetical protein